VQHPDRYREVLIDSEGVPIALSVWEPPAPRGTVVFLPGTAVHPLFYEEFLDALTTAGWAVVGVHPEGHGKSPRVRRTPRWPSMIVNVVDAVTWSREQLPAPVILMGSSQGSLIVLLAAADERMPDIAGGGPVGVLAHNVFDPAAAETAQVTRFGPPARLHRMLHGVLGGLGRILPRVPVPIRAYLDPARVFCTPWTAELFAQDPLCRPAYPMRFVAGLVTADTHRLFDGHLQVPVVVVTARRDPLFDLDDTRALCRRLRAPWSDLVVLDTECHLVLNEALDVALPAVLTALERLAASPDAAVGPSSE
jgi:alpha-beta hydrolase superfamily lysophospholipase